MGGVQRAILEFILNFDLNIWSGGHFMVTELSRIFTHKSEVLWH